MYNAEAYRAARNRVGDERFEQMQSRRTLEAAVRVAAQLPGNEPLYITLETLFYRNLIRLDTFDAWELTMEELHHQGWTASLDTRGHIRFFRRFNRTPCIPRLRQRAPTLPCRPPRTPY